VQTCFFADGLKKSLAEPDDSFHHNCGKSWRRLYRRAVQPFQQLIRGRAPGRPKPAGLTEAGRVHVRCAQRIAYTRPA
jgi:hypothetical protein